MRKRRLTLLVLTTVAVMTAPFVGSVLAAPVAVGAQDGPPTDGPGDTPSGGTASFSVSDLDAPTSAEAGDTVTVNATIINTGNASGQTQVTYRLDGRQRGAQVVQLGSGNASSVSFDLDTSGLSSGNHTHGVYVDGDDATATLRVENGTDSGPERGPVNGMPPGVDRFINTTPLNPGQVSPNSLAGKIRVESAYASNTTIGLERNSSNETSFNVTVTGHAENVTFFFQTNAIAASQNVSNVTAMVDGSPVQFGVTNASGSAWVGVEVDHFSSRTVTFTSSAAASPRPTLPGLSSPAGDLDGDALLEDVDGDGDGDVFDALSYYNNRKSDAVRNNPQQFDFDGDGTVGTVFDTVALYNKIQSQ